MAFAWYASFNCSLFCFLVKIDFYLLSLRLWLSSFDLTKTASSPPCTRKANSPSFALKITLRSHEMYIFNLPFKLKSAFLRRLVSTHLDWVSPHLMRSLRRWNLLLPHQLDQLMMASFSQRSLTIIRSPMSTSVVMRKEKVVLSCRAGLWGGVKGRLAALTFM